MKCGRSSVTSESCTKIKSELDQQKGSLHKSRGVFKHININFWTMWYTLFVICLLIDGTGM